MHSFTQISSISEHELVDSKKMSIFLTKRTLRVLPFFHLRQIHAGEGRHHASVRENCQRQRRDEKQSVVWRAHGQTSAGSFGNVTMTRDARSSLQRKRKLKSNDIDPACGHQGPCILRSLAHFNIGPAFVADSLHNVYLGVFVSIACFYVTSEPPWSSISFVNFFDRDMPSFANW